jgi:predicted ATPase
MLLESGQLVDHGGRLELLDSSAGLAIPVTLQESLAARLDRLAPVKEVVQLGAALGRSFTYEQISAVSLLDEVTLNTELGRLVEADILQLHGSPPDATFVFKHALIQDAAYDSLVSRRRREYHRRIAAALTERFPDLCEAEPELIARHWERAGNAEAAVAYLLRAGQHAIERSGYVEAVRHLDHGLSLLESVARSARRPQRELELQLALGTALVAAKGFAAPEVAAAYTRARELCETTGETGHALYTVLSGLLLYHQSRAELTRCLDLTHERLTLAERLGDAALEMQVYENFGTLAFWRGEFAAVPEHLERSVARWTRERDRLLARNYGTLSAVVCETYIGQALWFLGFPDQAVTRADNAVQQARAFGHANSLALAMSFAMSLRLLRGEAAITRQMAEEVIAYSTEQQLPFWLGYGMIHRGWALAAQGRTDEGIGHFLEGIGMFQGTGALIGGRFCIAVLARTYLDTGKIEEAAALFGGPLMMLEPCEDRFYDAELLRIRGEVLLAGDPNTVADAEALFNQALELSRQQGARSLELRASTSLARLWQRSGRAAAARELVEACRSRFTEGHATADLIAAAQSCARSA